MPLSEYDTKEALRAAADWLVASELPGSAAAREGIADTIPLVMMGMVEPDDLNDLAAIERRARASGARCRYAGGCAARPTQGSSKGGIRLRAFASARCRAMKRAERPL